MKERQVSSGGYIWRYGTEPKVDLKAFLEKRAVHRKILRGTKVTQYDTVGRRISTYLTISDAAKTTSIGNGEISANINGKQKSAGGFIWKKGWGRTKINVNQDGFGEALRAKSKWKKVRQYNSSGKYIRTFASVKAAASAVDLSHSAISGTLKSKTKLAGGFGWLV